MKKQPFSFGLLATSIVIGLAFSMAVYFFVVGLFSVFEGEDTVQGQTAEDWHRVAQSERYARRFELKLHDATWKRLYKCRIGEWPPHSPSSVQNLQELP